MRTARYLFPLVTLLATCANYGHGHHLPGDNPPPGECSTDDDCQSTKTCVEGRCKLKDPAPTPDAGAPAADAATDSNEAGDSPDTRGAVVESGMDGGPDSGDSDGALGEVGKDEAVGTDDGGSDGRDGGDGTDSRDAGVECHHNDDHCKQKDH